LGHRARSPVELNPAAHPPRLRRTRPLVTQLAAARTLCDCDAPQLWQCALRGQALAVFYLSRASVAHDVKNCCGVLAAQWIILLHKNIRCAIATQRLQRCLALDGVMCGPLTEL
jgi:hypothetical protein